MPTKQTDQDAAPRLSRPFATTVGERAKRDPEFTEEMREQFGPGTYGCHEAMHLAHVLAELVEQRLCEHMAVQINPAWTELARRAAVALYELYQAIGAEHMQEEPAHPNDIVTPEDRELLAQAYEELVGEGPYPAYAKVAREGNGAFTMCSLRAIARARLGAAAKRET